MLAVKVEPTLGSPVICGGAVLLGVYWLIRRTGKRWWIWSGALVAVVFSFLILLSPVLIEPLVIGVPLKMGIGYGLPF